MNTGRAIIIASAVISASIMFVLRWEIAAYGGQTYRLDRWTGQIVACNAVDEKRLFGLQFGVGLEYRCSELTESEIKKAVETPAH